MNEVMSPSYPLPSPFAQTKQKLEALRDKLNYNTYTALFGRTVDERQRAATEAATLNKQIESALGEAFDIAGQVASFASSPLSNGGLYSALDNFLSFMENPVAGAASTVAGGLPGLPGRNAH